MLYATVEKRVGMRVPLALCASLATDGISCLSFFKNISLTGLALIALPFHTKTRLSNIGTGCAVTFALPSGEAVTLSCETKWSNRTLLSDDGLMIGLEIPDPPVAYISYLGTLKERI